MIQEVKMYTVICDNCKDSFQNYDGFSAWFDSDNAEQEAMNKEWIEEDGKHYCTDCYKHNDDDELIIDKTRLDKFLKTLPN